MKFNAYFQIIKKIFLEYKVLTEECAASKRGTGTDSLL